MVKMPNKNEDGFSEMETDSPSSSDEESEEDIASEGDCEKRRVDCMENLAHLERQFLVLREQLYIERIDQVETQLSEVRGGRSQEYLGPLQSLLDTMNSRKEVADILKRYRLENIRNKYECEKQAAGQHFESEKLLAVDNLHEELLEKIRRLEEDSNNVDISWADWSTNVRTNKVRGPGRKKAVTVTGPYIVYMLKEEDIIEDWTIIRKSMKRAVSVSC